MKNKFLTIFLVIITMLCIFSIKSYASTEYSYLNENNGKYQLKFSVSEKTNLDFPDVYISEGFSSNDIYFIIFQNSNNEYICALSYANFVSDGTSITNRYNDSFNCYKFNTSTSSWEQMSKPYAKSYNHSSLTLVMSSDDVLLKSGSEIVFPKYVKEDLDNSEVGGDSGNTGEGGNSGSTDEGGDFEDIKGTNESDDYVYSEHFNYSSIYNISWVESYLDINQNPVDGIKKLINSYRNYFKFSASDLGGYWVCEKINFANNNGYFYYFLIAPGPLYSDYYYNRHHDYMFSGKEDVQCFPIIFVENGFYAPSTLCNKNSGGFECGSGYGYVFPNDIKYTGSDTSAYIILSNHDIYDSRFDETLVFTGPVTKNGTTLAPVIQRERTKGTLQVVLAEIIAIVPVILMIIAGLIGLRKALKMLSTVLRRS